METTAKLFKNGRSQAVRLPKEFRFKGTEIYPFDELSARKYSIIRTQLEKDGLMISERDLKIASIAMANKLIVVTHNVKEFKRIEKLDVEDWAKTG